MEELRMKKPELEGRGNEKKRRKEDAPAIRNTKALGTNVSERNKKEDERRGEPDKTKKMSFAKIIENKQRKRLVILQRFQKTKTFQHFCILTNLQRNYSRKLSTT